MQLIICNDLQKPKALKVFADEEPKLPKNLHVIHVWDEKLLHDCDDDRANPIAEPGFKNC
jgi:hypothetical protein